MPNDIQQVKTVPHDEDEERVFKLYGIIEAERMRLKKSPPADVKRLADVLVGTIMPLMMELAHFSAEQTRMVYEIADEVEGNVPVDTQFTVEDAKKFDLVAQYALAVASESLKQFEAGHPDHTKCMEIVNTANECLKIIEESTIEVEPDDEGEADSN